MTNYQGNSNKSRENPEKKSVKKEEKEVVEKVVTGEVITRKKPLARKIKDTFFGGDAKAAGMYIITDVFLPATRRLIVQAGTEGLERIVYGETSPIKRRPETRGHTVYNRAFDRPWVDPRVRPNLPDQGRWSNGPKRQSGDELILSSREEAELVLERLQDIIDKFQIASRADLLHLVGLPSTFIDHKWGWAFLHGSEIRQIREGYLLDLPSAEPL